MSGLYFYKQNKDGHLVASQVSLHRVSASHCWVTASLLILLVAFFVSLVAGTLPFLTLDKVNKQAFAQTHYCLKGAWQVTK